MKAGRTPSMRSPSMAITARAAWPNCSTQTAPDALAISVHCSARLFWALTFVAAILAVVEVLKSAAREKTALLKSPLRSPPENCGTVECGRRVPEGGGFTSPMSPARMRTRPEIGA